MAPADASGRKSTDPAHRAPTGVRVALRRGGYRVAGLLLERGLPRLLPFPWAASLVERLAWVYGWLWSRTGWPPLPRRALGLPARLARLFGETPPTAKRRELLRCRLSYLLILQLLNGVRRRRPFSIGRRVRHTVEILGEEHLRAALAQGRGVILISTHFGFFPLIRPVLDALGVPAVMVRMRPASRQEGDVSLQRDVWSRARALERVRSALTQNRACVFLVLGRSGAYVAEPFLRSRMPVGLGAFHLARSAGCSILPFFAVRGRRPGRFRLEFQPPLAATSADPPLEPVREFLGRYAAYVRRYPSHLSEERPARRRRQDSRGHPPLQEAKKSTEGLEVLRQDLLLGDTHPEDRPDLHD